MTVVVAIVAAWATPFLLGLSGPLAAVVGGFAGGFAAGFTGTVLAGGSLGQAFSAGLTSGAWGGLSAGLAYGIGSAAGAAAEALAKAQNLTKGMAILIQEAAHLAHGVSSGVVNDLRGGGFWEGFTPAYAGATFGPAPGDQYGQIKAAIIGGTAAAVSGGKFANGAISSAFQYMYLGRVTYPEHHYSDLGNGNLRLSYGGAGSGVYSEGTRVQMEALAVELDMLYAVPTTRREINALIGTPRDTPLILIETGGVTGRLGSNTDVLTGQISYDPTRFGTNGEPPFFTLGHEIHHAYEFITGTIQPMSDYTGQNPPWEKGALRAENIIRRFYGFPLKVNYTPVEYSYNPGEEPVMVLPPFEVKGN